MKLRWKVMTAVSVLMNIVTAAAVIANSVEQQRLTYPTPEMKTAFLRNYSPQPIIEKFRAPQFSFGSGTTDGAGAGKGYVTHQHDFDDQFTIRSEQAPALMQALSDDISAQLAKNGAQLLGRTVEPDSAIRFDYKLDRTIGTVTLSPIVRDAGVHRNTPLPACMADVVVKVAIADKWFARERDVIEAVLQEPDNPNPPGAATPK